MSTEQPPPPPPASTATPSYDDARAIRALIETWITATKAHDTTKLLSLLSDDVVFLTPGKEPFGKQEFAATAEQMKSLEMDVKSEIKELAVHGDWAWCRTHLRIAIRTQSDETTKRLAGYTLTILRKGMDGAWVIARDANMVTPE